MSVSSLTGNGLKDWLIQRVSAVYLAVYSVFLMGYMLMHSPMTVDAWQALFSCSLMKIATVGALLMVLLHAWVGLWTVSTDYIKCVCIRFTFQIVIMLWLLAQFVWALTMIWGQ